MMTFEVQRNYVCRKWECGSNVWGFARPRQLIDIHGRVGSSSAICQSRWETGTAIEQESAREREREIVNAREREGERSSFTGACSHHTAHFISASQRRHKTVRKRRKRRTRSRTPDFVPLVFCGIEGGPMQRVKLHMKVWKNLTFVRCQKIKENCG